MRPKLLLLDEPTANVDPVNARKIEDVLVSFRREGGITIIMVTHSPPQASRVSDYIAFIYMGQLVEVGPADQVFVNPKNKLTEKFLRGEVS
jgi:phosphate transport system ATP-binding protein